MAPQSPLDIIRVDGLVVSCIVGVYPHERTRPQPLEVDLEMHLDTRPAALGDGLSGTVDYARITGMVRFLLEGSQFLLLESAAEAIARVLLLPPTADVEQCAIEAVRVRLRKPQALRGAIPSLEIFRTKDAVNVEIETKPFGHVDVAYETKGCGVYRLRVAPHQSIPTHVHRRMDEHELILGTKLRLQGAPIAAGTGIRWPKDLAHRYDNDSATEQTVLCIDRPAFSPDDEIEVEVSSLPPLPHTTAFFVDAADA